MKPPCLTCANFRAANGGRCHRDIKLQSGQVLKQCNSGRSIEVERDERAPCWKSMRRDMADICGKSGKFWQGRGQQ